MSIRRKLTFLLLFMTLVPLAVNRIITAMISRETSSQLAIEKRNELVESAENSLQIVTEDFSRYLDAKENNIRLIVRFQAEKIEKLLADVMLAKEQNTDESKQIVDRQLEAMEQDYSVLREMSNGAVLRQYVIFDSGFFMVYPQPKKEGKPVRDPRKMGLYQEIKTMKRGQLVPSPPAIDEATGLTVTVVATPLFYPDGSFAGMTGLDLVTKNLFSELVLPEEAWKGEATEMLVKRLGPRSEAPGQIAVLEKQLGTQVTTRPDDIEETRLDGQQIVGRQLRLRYLKVADPKLLNEIVDQAEAGKSGIVRMPFNGKESIWAYGPSRTGTKANEPFLIVIVPVDKVVEKANQMEYDIVQATQDELYDTAIIFFALVVITTLIGIRSAKVVTRPLDQLTQAGIRLSEGDYHAHVEVNTHDELQRLAEVFNEAGPKLLEREKMLHSLAMASEIQQQLLPQAPPECEGLEVAGQSLYCDETGGDYFDYLTLRKEGAQASRLGVAIGDVSGHGIGAALIMASVRSVLRSHAGDFQDRLDELMCLLNRSLTEETETGRFVTFCFSLFDPEQRTLRWVSAGHDPAMFMHRDEKTGNWAIDELPNSGMPLGVTDDADYEAMGPLELRVGDIVLFGTDGVWDTSDASGNSFGKERLRQILLDMHDQSADAIRMAIVQAVTTFRGHGPQLDDVTLVVVRVV